MLEAVLRELRTPQIPYDGAAIMKNRAICADFIESRFKKLEEGETR